MTSRGSDRDRPLTYSDTGVDIDRGDEVVRLIKPLAEGAARPGVVGGLGGFSGLFEPSFSNLGRPLLAAATDSVGTKVMVAFRLDRHDTVGIDCVAMCTNDLVVGGAEPLFFLDYIGINRAEPEKVAQIVSGVAEGCRRAGCALLGGETAEMPDLYRQGEYDLVGFAVGAVCGDRIVDGSRVEAGDVLLGLASSGIHSNGFSLARAALLDRAGHALDRDPGSVLGRTLGEELLEPTRIYVRPLLDLMSGFDVRAMANITGGGIPGNVPRVLPSGLGVRVDWGSWPVPPIFHLIQQAGRVDDEEMRRTFNQGIGMVLVVPAGEVDELMRAAAGLGETPHVIGEVVAS